MIASAHRIPSQAFAEPIGRALALLPAAMRDRISHVRFVCGVDPVFAGVHSFVDIDDGRSFADTAHCCYPYHLLGPADRRVTTVVLPTPVPPSVVIHELGHALHHSINFEHTARPVTEYAKTNRFEAFAEAFVSWFFFYGDQDVAASDKATLRLFSGLAAA